MHARYFDNPSDVMLPVNLETNDIVLESLILLLAGGSFQVQDFCIEYNLYLRDLKSLYFTTELETVSTKG